MGYIKITEGVNWKESLCRDLNSGPRPLCCQHEAIPRTRSTRLSHRGTYYQKPRCCYIKLMLKNGSFGVLTGRPLDITFGPRSWKREVTKYFMDYKRGGDGDYGITFVPLLHMLADGKQLRSVAVDYDHPQEQTRLEEDNLSFNRKRVAQLVSILGDIQRHVGLLRRQKPTVFP